MTNAEIARVFERIAMILNLKGDENPFRIRAYDRASQTIANISVHLQDVYTKGGLKALNEIPSIGKDLALKIEELITTGKLHYLDEVEKGLPAGLLQILEIEGIGPKKTKFLWEKFNVQNIDDLKALALSGKLEPLKGWGEKSVKKILENIDRFARISGRIVLSQALALAEEIVKQLKASKLCTRVEIAGSLRRMRETIGDIDILATSERPEKVMELFCSLPQVESVTAKGPTKSTVFLTVGLDCDLRVVDDDVFGAALHYFTGSKDHNVHIRKIGIDKGVTISEWGVYKGTAAKKGKLVASHTEEDVFKTVGLSWIPPELREDRGEIEAAYKNQLPSLIELKDIKADFHMHTNVSDGSASAEDMIKEARKKGLKIVALTDHASPMGMVKGIKPENIASYIKHIHALRKKYPSMTILAGAEVDILEDGSLFLSDDDLKKLDWVVVSVHSHFRQSREVTTKRVLNALDNPYVNVLGHPTGRLLGKREGIDIDIDAVLKKAKEKKIAVELNCSSERLDLSDVHLKRAKELGVKIAIGSDAHSPNGLEYLNAIGQARRGWLEKEDVLNTMNWKKIEKTLGM